MENSKCGLILLQAEGYSISNAEGTLHKLIHTHTRTHTQWGQRRKNKGGVEDSQVNDDDCFCQAHIFSKVSKCRPVETRICHAVTALVYVSVCERVCGHRVGIGRMTHFYDVICPLEQIGFNWSVVSQLHASF